MRLFLLLIVCSGWSYLAKAQEKDEASPYYIYSIYFGGGSYFITPDQAEGLTEWLKTIPYLEDAEISIHSHTDNIGSKAYNDWLSQMRSESAFQRLLDEGIPSEVISIEDFGELNPVYDNASWEGKLKNRRVDINIKPLAL